MGRDPAWPGGGTTTLTEAELVPAGSPTWERALARVPHDVYHLPAYAELDAGLVGGSAHCLVYTEDGGTALLPVVLRQIPGSDRLDACSPYGYPGPVGDAGKDDEGFWRRAAAAIQAALAREGIVSCFVRLHPLLGPPPARLARHGALVQHGHTVSIDLTLPEEQLWSQTRANHRRQINRARRDGVQVRTDFSAQLSEFVEIYHQTMTRVGAGAYYFFDGAYFDGLRAALGPELHLVSVHAGDAGEQTGEQPDGHDSPMIGGGLFFEHAGIVQYHLGATRDGFGAQQPTKVMFDEVRRWAKARGCTQLHLGGGLGGAADELFHFKAGFSDRHLPFHSWRLVGDAEAYQALGEATGTAPEPAAGFFPAYRRPLTPPVRTAP